jgi:DNA polymerase III subunit gamma/tau
VDPDLNPERATPGDGPHVALYRRWRAQTFGRIVGQEAVVTTLRNAVRTGQVGHALLFVGPRGTGKTSMARIVAKALNCTNLQDGDPCDACPSCVAIREGRALDVVELDAATNNKVDDMRELLERTWTAPSDLRRKVYIIDEVQRITQGWDVLLRTLEEPPDHVAFVFCTTDASQIRPAVLSRVQRFEFRRLTIPQIEGKLATILAADGREAEPEAIRLVARQAAGGMRDAESMLDQLLASSAERMSVEAVRDLLGLVDSEVIDAFLDALVRGDALAGIAVLDGLEEAGRDLGAFLDQLVVALRERLAAALTGSAADPARSVAELTEAARRIAAIDPSRQGVGGLHFQLELALVGAAAAVPSVTAELSPAVRRPSRAPAEPRSPDVEPGDAVPVGPGPRASTLVAHASPVEPMSSGAGDVRSASGDEPTASPASRTRGARRPAPHAEVAPGAPAAGTPEPASETEVDAPVAEPVGAMASTSTDALVRPADRGGLDELDRAWPEIVAELSKSPPIKPLIEVCRPIAVDGDVVTLGFPEGKSFLKDVAERRRTTLEEGIGRAIGRSVAVRLVATNLDHLAPPIDEEAERVMAAAKRIFADDLVDAGEVG